MSGQRQAPAALYPRDRAGTHCTGGWVGPRAGLNRCGKSRPPPGFNPRTAQPVASRYTDYTTRPTKIPITVSNFSFHSFTKCLYFRFKQVYLGNHSPVATCSYGFFLSQRRTYHLPNYRSVLLNHPVRIFTCSMVKTKPAADTDREASNSRQSNTTGHNSGASDKGSPPHYAT